jgi:hypothetical protein
MVVGNPVAADHRAVAPQVFDLYVAPANGGRHTTHLRCSSLWGSFWSSNLADQMRLMPGQSSISYF